MITTTNPATEAILAEYSVMNDAALEQVIALSDSCQLSWKQVGFEDRSRQMNRLAELLRAEKETFAALISREMGKPFAQAVGEVVKSSWVCDYYAENAGRFLRPEEKDLDGQRGVVKFEPLGLVLGIMPWNFPFWQVFRFAVPAIMAGNGVIVKHAPNVTGSAIAIEKLFRDAGFPEHLYRTVHIAIDEVDRLSGYMIGHPSIKAVSVTGSTAAGRAVAAKAGHALKPCVLELGGSDPYIVLEDADISQAVEVCVAARLLNAGQSCISAKRFIVHSRVVDEFESLFLRELSNSVMGDPFDHDVQIGPIARRDLRDQVHDQVLRSVADGARLLCGGEIPTRKGYFYPPTLLSGVRKGMAVYEEETFGPVAALIEAADEDDAVRIANDSPYGLGSAVLSADLERALAVADRLETGNCFINTMVKSDPRMPFGGVKQSGFGRELSAYGLKEFVNIKSYCYSGK
ncbi:MAG: NAD-dependent succinate-semialdehyde dehydrogenase [Chlorobiaceae bacterium]|nr:NAD-dependent succinate-semialdehyde dehydrogenase [Chlorobiaceae bacterium]